MPPPHNGKTSAHATPSKLNARVRNAASLPGHAALRCLVSLQTNSCQGDPLRLAGWAFLQMAYLSEPPWAERMGLSWRSCPGSRYSGGISPTTSTQHTHARLDRGAVSITQVSPANQVIRDGVASAAACYTRLRIPHRLSPCQPSASDRTAGAAGMRFRRPRARCCERSHVPFAASAPVPRLRTLVAFHRLERAAPLMTTSSLWVAAWASRFDVGPASSIRIAIVEDRVARRS